MIGEEITKIKRINENLRGSTADKINTEDVNIAATLAALATRLLDAMSNIYEIHSNVVRLGHNLDLIVNSHNNSVRDLNGTIHELKLRVEDLEALMITQSKSKALVLEPK